MKNFFTSKLLLASAFVAASACFANATTMIAGNDSSISSLSGNWSWDGSEHSELRTALESPANFGPGGTDTTDTIDTIDIAAPTAAALASVDIFVASWWHETDSDPYEADIIDWYLAGGSMLLLQDDSNRNGLSSRLGFLTINGAANPTTVTGPLGNGPHGTVGPVNQVGNIGYFDNATILGLGGQIFGTNAAGNATIVAFEAGVLGANAGRLVAMADVDFISGNFGGANYNPLNDKGRLGLNAMSYLLAAPAPVPLPAGLPLMLAGVGAFAVLRARRKA